MGKKIAKIISGTAVFMFALAFAFTASAAPSLFGGATLSDGSVSLVSNTGDADTANDFSGIAFDVPAGTTVSSLSSLSADYNVTDDDCAGGSPRFQLRLDNTGDDSADGNVFVYMGPTPNFTGCTPDTWTSTGDLLTSTDARFDLSQFGGPFYGTVAELESLLGSATVLQVSLVADGGWALEDKEQTILVDNVSVNGTTFDFTPPPANATDKGQCKNDGWKAFTAGYKNQGQCVSDVENNSKNR